MIALSKIRVDGGTQSRVQLDLSVVAEYAELYKTGVPMKPIVVFFDGAEFWLADGFHRYHAAAQAGQTEIFEERIPGTQRAAILYSLQANSTHGLRRTNADKRKAVKMMLDDAEWSAWSSNEIARRCGVSHTFVDSVRKAILQPLQDSGCPLEDDAASQGFDDGPSLKKTPTNRTVTRGGSTYQQNTGNIKRRRPVAEPRMADASAVAASDLEFGVGGTHHLADQIQGGELSGRIKYLGQQMTRSIEELETANRTADDGGPIAAIARIDEFYAQLNSRRSLIDDLIAELVAVKDVAESCYRRAEIARSNLSATAEATQ